MLRYALFIGYFGIVFGAPQGHVHGNGQRGGFIPISPCSDQHHAASLIQAQSIGRIVNHQNHKNVEHNFETAASNPVPNSVYVNGNPPANRGPYVYGNNHGAPLPGVVPNGIQPPQFQQNSQSSIQTQHSSYSSGSATSQTGPQLFRPAAVPVPQNQNFQSSHLHHHYTVSNNGQSIANGGPIPVAVQVPAYPVRYANTAPNVGPSHQYQQNSHFASQIGQKLQQNQQLGQVIQQTFASTPLDPSAEKHIYVHVPPEDFEESSSKHQQLVYAPQLPPKKHYKIVFIKAPTPATSSYKQQIQAAQQSEEKTLIYVLVKKPDEPTLEEIQSIQESTFKTSKPEVYFIKYKARDEAKGQPIDASNLSEVNTASDNQIFDGSGLIDIRSGTGESGSTGSQTSHVSPVLPTSFNEHTSYGVPLN
ncbi:uncharacterized protein [Drosophila tropicalis]|uniref:uncharacterized protein n=1 Tax=Drosophila tropicalis TaxID=46794 RepID=UPI0035ABA36A